MAVYRRGYQRYRGAPTSHGSRLLVLPRFAWQRLMQQRLIVILLVVSLFWPVASAFFVYLSNRAELLQSFGGGAEIMELLKIDGNFFLVFMNAQAFFAIVLAAFAGPSLIAPDLANGALPLYFSRPMSRSEYVFARMLVLVGLLSPVTWVPGVLLFLMQTGMAGWPWFSTNWDLGAAVLAGSALWIVFVSLVAMASSAYVKWRIVAGALVLGVFFVLAGAAEMANAVLRVEWASAFNPGRAMQQVWRWMLGMEPAAGPGVWECLLAVSAMMALLALVLERKLRPVEVVS
jgi:ABC-2 type transport system permease protein